LVGVPATPCFAIERKTEFLEADGDGYSVYCKRGRREAIEDRYSAVVDLQGDDKQGFGIFDGHGGSKAAENLNVNIMNEIGKSEGGEDISGRLCRFLPWHFENPRLISCIQRNRRW
jgi:hypothetical protein